MGLKVLPFLLNDLNLSEITKFGGALGYTLKIFVNHFLRLFGECLEKYVFFLLDQMTFMKEVGCLDEMKHDSLSLLWRLGSSLF